LLAAHTAPTPRTHRRNRRRVRRTASGRSFLYNLRFPGQYYQAETGLNQNVNRDYDPLTGKYVESDPIGLSGGSYSTYPYARANPLSAIDPLGLAVTWRGSVVSVGATLGVGGQLIRFNLES
jgi:RHS repeat-associated protein